MKKILIIEPNNHYKHYKPHYYCNIGLDILMNLCVNLNGKFMFWKCDLIKPIAKYSFVYRLKNVDKYIYMNVEHCLAKNKLIIEIEYLSNDNISNQFIETLNEQINEPYKYQVPVLK